MRDRLLATPWFGGTCVSVNSHYYYEGLAKLFPQVSGGFWEPQPVSTPRMISSYPSSEVRESWALGVVDQLRSTPMSPLNRKAGERRLVNMSAAPEPEHAWAPDLPPEGLPWEQTFPLSEDASYVQRLSFDELQRLVEWAVVQMRRRGGRWRKVAVYDTCHGKGVHVHLYDRQENEFTEAPVSAVTSYQDIEDGLDYVLERVTQRWQENERRSDRGN